MQRMSRCRLFSVALCSPLPRPSSCRSRRASPRPRPTARERVRRVRPEPQHHLPLYAGPHDLLHARRNQPQLGLPGHEGRRDGSAAAASPSTTRLASRRRRPTSPAATTAATPRGRGARSKGSGNRACYNHDVCYGSQKGRLYCDVELLEGAIRRLQGAATPGINPRRYCVLLRRSTGTWPCGPSARVELHAPADELRAAGAIGSDAFVRRVAIVLVRGLD